MGYKKSVEEKDCKELIKVLTKFTDEFNYTFKIEWDNEQGNYVATIFTIKEH